MNNRWRVLALAYILARASLAQQPEKLFLTETAYDPVPSPDGKQVAFVLTGRDSTYGSGGFGRSNLRSVICFTDERGTQVHKTPSYRFLAGWLFDSSGVVSYRDWHFALTDLDGKERSAGSMPTMLEGDGPQGAERVAYDSNQKTFVWIEHSKTTSLLQTPGGTLATFAGLLPLSASIVPSPDGRYLAIGGPSEYLYESHDLWVFDTQRNTWANLGRLDIHPDPNWDYIKPSWNPWFSDGRMLAFFSGNRLRVASADGRTRRTIRKVKNAGLAVPSKDGRTIAYATFIRRPGKIRPDLSFWGGSTIWVVPVKSGAAKQVTKPADAETFCLSWLTPSTLIFDRIGESLFNDDARIWTVSVADN